MDKTPSLMYLGAIEIDSGNPKQKMELNMPIAIQSLNLTQLKTVWKMQLKNPFSNEDSIKEMEKWIQTLVDWAKDDWHEASQAYQREFQTTHFIQSFNEESKKQIQEIEAKNKKLTAKVKHEKANYEKCVKRLISYNELKEKLNITLKA